MSNALDKVDVFTVLSPTIKNNTTMYQKTHVLHLNALRLRAKDIDTTIHYTHGYTGTTYYKTEACVSSQTISIKKTPTRIYRAKNVDTGTLSKNLFFLLK